MLALAASASSFGEGERNYGFVAVLDIDVILIAKHFLQFRVKGRAQGCDVVVRTRAATAAKVSDAAVREP